MNVNIFYILGIYSTSKKKQNLNISLTHTLIKIATSRIMPLPTNPSATKLLNCFIFFVKSMLPDAKCELNLYTPI